MSPYYHHFRECLELSYPFPTGSKQELKFQAQQINTDSVPQYSMYERVKELVREIVLIPNVIYLVSIITGNMGIKS